MASPNWLCCQLGAREHFAIPRALHQHQQLACLITDAWVSPTSLFNQLPSQALSSLRDRFHPDLTNAPVQSFTTDLLAFEFWQRYRKTGNWERMIARNHWFQQRAIAHLDRLTPQQLGDTPTLFTYSYAASELLRYAKKRGWRTVLGQIDPGPMEEKIVAAEYARDPELAPDWQRVPESYWQSWRNECQLADEIVVNSVWSQQLLKQAGIEQHKISVMPLVYDSPQTSFQRVYPSAFSPDRPLRVLYLGLVTLRKGVAAVLDAIERSQGLPIEFWMVGSPQIVVPPKLQNHPQVRWVGAVSRSQTQKYYQQADVFLFPTLSDGFGLTQLEAQAWHLPIVASSCCGEVVTDKVNGRILAQVTGQQIAEILHGFLQQPKQLAVLAQHSTLSNKVSLTQLSQQLLQMTDPSFAKGFN
jgi:glycosyltransferase involved in cell wall biosynthesis